ncbi:hypothetical protein RSAG8_13932, partial [Rhizoctonia solani AG-8 WAC10335]
MTYPDGYSSNAPENKARSLCIGRAMHRMHVAILDFSPDLLVLAVISWNLANLIEHLDFCNAFMAGRLIVGWSDS